MKRILFCLTLLLATAVAQTALPNLTYNASLNAACATPNAFCANSVFTGVPSLVATGQTGTALDVASNNYALATVTVSGTYGGATINFDFSDPSGGTSYFQELCARTDANILELSEALPSNQTRAWQCPVFATSRFRVRISAIGSGSLNTWVTLTQSSIDPSPTVSAAGSGVVGSPPVGNPVLVAGTDGTNVQTLTVAPQGSTTAGQNGILAECAVQAIPTLVNGQTQPCSADTSGRIRVSINNAQPTATSSGAPSTMTPIVALTTAAAVKASAGNVYGWSFYNPNASLCVVQFFNVVPGSVTLGTTQELLDIPVPATQQATIAPTALAATQFGTAISIAATTAAHGASTCAVGVIANVWFN